MKQIIFKLFNVPNILEICSPQKLLNNKLWGIVIDIFLYLNN